jgi:hypothetical protein
MSGSLMFKNKKEKLLEICSLVGYSVLKLSNTLSPMIINDNKLITLKPSKKISTTKHFIHKLNEIELFEKHINLKTISSLIHSKLKRKSFIILVGDFLGDINLTLLASCHEVFVVIIRDQFEENPEILGDVEVIDPESGESSEFYFGKSARNSYKKRYNINDKNLYQHLRSLGISYTKIISQK